MKSKVDWLIVGVLGVAHAVSDCAAGYLVGRIGHDEGIAGAGALLMLYNVLAFGGQLPVGVMLDKMGRFHYGMIGSLGMMAVALLLNWFSSGFEIAVLSVGLAGMASAVFHVAGGGIALQRFGSDSGGVGVFAGPGVVGLAIGGLMAWSGCSAQGWILLALALVGGLFVFVSRNVQRAIEVNPTHDHGKIEAHDVWMILLLLAIAMRSAVWNLWEQMLAGDYAFLMAAALAAATGKIGGGILAHRVGVRVYVGVALALAAPLLAMGQGRPYLFLPGLALLQSATAPSLTLLCRFLPGSPATAAGMGLGLAIALGAIPMLLGLDGNAWFFAGVPLAVAFILIYISRKRKRAAHSSS